MLRRTIEDSVRMAVTDTPAVLINGARQVGKTTLVQAVATKTGPSTLPSTMRYPGHVKPARRSRLLSYRVLSLFPCAPGRWGLATTAWRLIGEEDLAFTWPIWEFSAPPDTIRSMLQLGALIEPEHSWSLLRARGITAVFRSRRIKVGGGSNYKLNFSPAQGV